MVDESIDEDCFKGKVCCHCNNPASLFHKVHLCDSCYDYLVVQGHKLMLVGGVIKAVKS